MAISSINQSMSGSSWGAYNQKLTKKTKEELDSLGIAYNNNISENEAKQLIRNAKTQNDLNNNQNQNSQSNLFEKAKELAKKLGIEVDEKIDFKQLLTIIENALEARISGASNNMSELQYLKALSSDLSNLQAQANASSGYDNTNQALMKTLEMMSEYNKNYLNR